MALNYGSIYTSPLVLSVCVNNQLISQKIENMLCYHALNPAHVPFYVENSHTLASTCTCRIRRADIEVSNEDIIVGIISSPTCYPLSNYFFWLDSLIDNPVHYDRQIKKNSSLIDLYVLNSQAKFIHYNYFLPYMSLRYFLEGCRPSKTVSQSFIILSPLGLKKITINNSQISRVFSSNWELSVSAPIVKFHAIYLKDSYPIITLFMQDNTYLPRNFATLGSLELQPPVFTDYIQICLI